MKPKISKESSLVGGGGKEDGVFTFSKASLTADILTYI